MTRDETLAYNRAYYETNRAHLLAAKAVYWQENRARLIDEHAARYQRQKEDKKVHYLANRERLRAVASKSYYANKATSVAWNAANRASLNAKASARRAAQLYATPRWLTPEHVQEMKIIYQSAQELGYHVDHVVPLKGKTVCGLHVPWNLQALPPYENRSKGNRLMDMEYLK